ncbi:hypothetical protein ACQJBY_061504 [Aegilops geniculata]
MMPSGSICWTWTASPGDGPKIRVHGLTLRPPGPDGEQTVPGSDLDVPRGVVMGVIGPSGSGKSTLLRALNRLWEPAPGAVTLDGADIRGLDVLALRRRVGMLFQLPAMFHGTVADNVRYGPRLRGETLTDAQVEELLGLSDLDAALASPPASELSVGQAQRVALARTLADDPEVLLLDEPTSALDPISTQNIEEAIVRLEGAGAHGGDRLPQREADPADRRPRVPRRRRRRRGGAPALRPVPGQAPHGPTLPGAQLAECLFVCLFDLLWSPTTLFSVSTLLNSDMSIQSSYHDERRVRSA